MLHKKLLDKANTGLRVFREQGVLGFSIVSLEFIRKHTNSKYRGKIKLYSEPWLKEIIGPDGLELNRNWPGTNKKSLTFNWLMPPPGKGSGGHVTIFRFIQFLEKSGHKCRIYFHNADPKSKVEDVKRIMGDSFPPVKAPMKWLMLGEQMAEADGVFATSWETAYSVNSSGLKAKKFYFVQDFEPYFFPKGSQYILAENTYKLGFYGITAGGWLAKKLKTDYGMATDFFSFGSDSNIYQNQNHKKRKEIVFYARPYTERRGFEIGVMALDIFHRRHLEYNINFLGWDITAYDIPFPYENLKILEHGELNQVYNRCSAGLVISLTNMSLLPLELLSSGCIPVINEGENNRLVSDNPFIAYSDSTPVALADKLTEIVNRKDSVDYSRQASDSVKNNSWEESGKHFVKIVERETRKAET
jgi:glycosyltransferase involved in cell wall biosynthesis